MNQLFNLRRLKRKYRLIVPLFVLAVTLTACTNYLWENFKLFKESELIYSELRSSKLIYEIITGTDEENYPNGREQFQNCRYKNCYFTKNSFVGRNADLIIFMQGFRPPRFVRPPNQTWAVYFAESPYLTEVNQGTVNWTMTYLKESTFYAPYFFFRPLIEMSGDVKPTDNHQILKRKRMIAWYVSNCAAFNDRLQYSHELGKHVQVDIFGKCGSAYSLCSRGDDTCRKKEIQNYRFYLAFENANCRGYISEKLFIPLSSGIIPIVMGAPIKDYQDLLPGEKYFIHVNQFQSPRQLGEFLNQLSANDTAYNEYLQWHRKFRIIQRINRLDFCDLCRAIHNKEEKVNSINIKEYWSVENQCFKSNLT